MKNTKDWTKPFSEWDDEMRIECRAFHHHVVNNTPYNTIGNYEKHIAEFVFRKTTKPKSDTIKETTSSEGINSDILNMTIKFFAENGWSSANQKLFLGADVFAKPKPFITEDLHECKDGDKIWVITKDPVNYFYFTFSVDEEKQVRAQQLNNGNTDFKYFHSEEAAKEYADSIKPRISLKDIEDAQKILNSDYIREFVGILKGV